MWDGKLYNGASSTLSIAAKAPRATTSWRPEPGIVTRGVLIDAARLRGVDAISRGDGVGLDDVERAERECGITIGEGDVLLLRTGQLGQRDRPSRSTSYRPAAPDRSQNCCHSSASAASP